jgi:hypothetical protein
MQPTDQRRAAAVHRADIAKPEPAGHLPRGLPQLLIAQQQRRFDIGQQERPLASNCTKREPSP